MVLPPNSGCAWKVNGTRTFIQPMYQPPGVMYWASGDVVYFDSSYTNSSIFFNNSRVIVTNNGDILAERTNYYTYFFFNPSDNNISVYF